MGGKGSGSRALVGPKLTLSLAERMPGIKEAKSFKKRPSRSWELTFFVGRKGSRSGPLKRLRTWSKLRHFWDPSAAQEKVSLEGHYLATFSSLGTFWVFPKSASGAFLRAIRLAKD